MVHMRIKVGATIIIIIMRNQEKIRSKAVSLFQSYIFSTCVWITVLAVTAAHMA